MLAQTTVVPFPTRRAGDVAARIEILAADLIDLNAEGDARRPRLLEKGWSAAFLDEHEAEARKQANVEFVRDINEDRPLAGRKAEDQIVDIIRELLPSTQFIVATLQARNIPVGEINLFLRKGKARAALAFIHQAAN